MLAASTLPETLRQAQAIQSHLNSLQLAMAMWLLPVPVPPIRITLRWLSRKAPPARSRTSCSLIGVPSKVMSGHRLDERQLGPVHLVADRAGPLLGDLGLQQRADEALEALLALHAGRDNLVLGGAHASERQRPHHRQDLMPFHARLLP